jgi:hypothetical protein
MKTSIVLILIISTILSCKKSEKISIYKPKKITISKRFGDRRYITDILTKVFGEDSKTIINLNIFKKPDLYGYPCDLYNDIKHTKKGEELPKGPDGIGPEQVELDQTYDFCQRDLLDTKLPMFSPDTNIRKAAMSKVCHMLSENLKDIDRPFNSKNINQVYQRFYPYEELDQKETQVLIGKAREQNLKSKWKIFHLVLCLNEKWQIL